MKKKFRKLLCMVLAFVTVLTNLSMPVSADTSGTLNVDTSVGWSLGGTSYGTEGLMTINGDIVYCLERLETYYSGMTYTGTSDFSSLGYDSAIVEKLSLLHYFGAQKAKSQNNIDWYSVVGSAIWAETGQGKGWILSTTFHTDAKVKDAIAVLQNDVANYYVKPSFTGNSASVKAGETIRLTDTNGVLNTYRIQSADGLTANIEGNDLVITGSASAKDTSVITFVKNIASSDIGGSLLYDAGSGVQKLGSFKVANPISGSVNVNVEKHGNLKIAKKDNSGNYVSGVEFVVSYNADMSSPIGTYTTGNDGTVTVSNLNPGTVYVQETKVPEHLILDGTIKSVTITASQTAEFTAVNNRKATLTIAKQDEKGAFVPKVQFKVSYNADMSSPIGTYTTGEDGTVTVSNLLPKTVYIQEVNVPSHLLLDSSIKSVMLVSGETVSFTAVNDWKQGQIKVVKKDAESGKVVKVSGAVFEIFDENNKKVDTITTDTTGTATSKLLDYGTYYVKEKIAPDGYLIQTEVSENIAVIEHNKLYSVTISNERETGKISLVKSDSETANPLKDGVYALYAGKDILDPADGKVIYKKDALVSTFPATDKSGKTELANLYLGTYYIKEVTAPDGYVLDSKAKDVTLSYKGQDVNVSLVSLSVTDQRQTGKVTITKTDAETGKTVSGAIYGLYAKEDILHPDGLSGVEYKKDTLVAKFPATDKDGKASLEDLYLGSYYIKEITAPDGYVLSKEVYPVTLSYEGQTVAVASETAAVTDAVQRGTISLVKKDKELKSGAQGDAVLSGAVYGLYAKEDIQHKDGKTGVISYDQKSGSIHQLKLTKGESLVVKDTKATAGALLATAKTDENGEIAFSNLYLGLYYIKEITPSEGYLLDKTEYIYDLSYEGQEINIRSDVNSTSLEQVKKQAFELFKGGHTSTGKASPLADVEFTVKLESDVTRLGWDDAPVYDVLVTDKNGLAKSIELPYGTYRVKETLVPEGYLPADDFFVTITEDSRTAISYTNNIIINDQFTALLKAVKLDKETGKTILLSGTEFKIKALTDVFVDGKSFKAGEYIGFFSWNIFDGFYVDSWTTNKDGYVQLEKVLGAGTYQLEEIKAPEGYTLDKTPVTFKITNKGMYELAKDGKTPVITAYKENKAVKGIISLYKKGEVLADYKDGAFIYEERYLAGASFGVYAKEDILDPSGDGSILHKKDALVTTITTNADGIAKSEELYLGRYYLKELSAPEGYVLSEKIIEADLSYIDDSQENAVVFESRNAQNERQKVQLSVVKVDADTKKGLEGAEFTLYNAKDIKNADGKVVVPSGTALETVKSDKDGNILFAADIPFGLYEVKETKAPLGYATSEEVISFDASIKDKNAIQHFEAVAENHIITVALSKLDITDKKELPGASLEVRDEDGKLIDAWVSGDTPHIIKGLLVGKSYTLTETKPSDGYVTAESITFTIEDTKEVQKVVMEDDFTKVEITKTDMVTGQPVEGAILTIYKADEDGNAGEKIVSWVSLADDPETEENESIFYIEKLPVGSYILREELADAADLGFVTAQDILFEVEDTGILQKVNMEDDFTKVGFQKVDASGNPVAGAILAVIPVDEDGNPLYGETFETWQSVLDDRKTEEDESIHIIERLPVGSYTLIELSAPDGFVKAQPVAFEVKDTADLQTVSMVNKQVTVTKTDITNKEELPGAELTVTDKESGEVVDSWISTDEPHNVSGLEEGKTYILTEVTAPNGYYVAESIEFTVNGLKIDQHIVMEDAPILTDIEIIKLDDSTKQPITGKAFEFTIYADADCKMALFTVNGDTKTGVAVFEDLRFGTYFIKETKAPRGYKLSDEVVEIVLDAETENIGQKISFSYANVLEPVVQTGDDSQFLLWSMASIVSLAGIFVGFLFSGKKRRLRLPK